MLALFSDPGFIVPLALVQLLGLLVLIWFIDYHEREPLAMVALLAVWGGTFAPAMVIALRDPILDRLHASKPVTVAMSSALLEEPVKGLALVAALGLSYAAARHFGILEFEGISDGIVYGAAIGLGFAFTEDIFYLVQQGSITEGLSVFHSRANFLGINMLAHAAYTGIFGAALGIATWERSWFNRIAFPAMGLGVAIILHGAHNGLEASGHRTVVRALDFAVIVLFFGGMALWVAYQQRVIRDTLASERDWGLIDEREWHETWSYGDGMRRQWQLVKDGRLSELRAARALHDELVELAFAVWRLRRMGVQGLWTPLEHRRRAVRKLQDELADVRVAGS